MASTFVDINKACTCKVKSIKFFPDGNVNKTDAVIGKSEPIEGRPVIVPKQEDKSETDNYVRVRRVDLSRGKEKQNFSENFIQEVFFGKSNEISSHLRDFYKKSTRGLEGHKKESVAQLLDRFQDRFSRHEWDIGLTHLTEHTIKTGGAPPIKQASRRVPLAYAEEEKKAIEDLKAKGVIRNSVSPWASPIVLVSKRMVQ